MKILLTNTFWINLCFLVYSIKGKSKELERIWKKIKNICNIISSGLDAKTVIGFMIAGVVVIALGIIINTKAKAKMD